MKEGTQQQRSAEAVERENGIRAMLAAEGIESLDALVERLGAHPGLAEREDSLLALNGERKLTGKLKPHKVPTVPLLVNGVSREPESIREHNGKPLYSTPGVTSQGKAVLHSFTRIEELQEFLSTPLPNVALEHDLGTTNPDSLPVVASYFEHDDNQGDRLQNNPGRAWRNLVRVGRGILGLGDWNDIISSVDWCRWDISLYEHVDYLGSSLHLRAGRTYHHLSQFGWNDRASSTVNWGRRF